MNPLDVLRLASTSMPTMSWEGPERRVGRDRRQPRIVEVRPTRAHIDAGALEDNLRTVDRHVGDDTRVLAVVKADGYGHGAIESARAFVHAGAWGLAVSLVEEGVELRQARVLAPIVVLGGVHPGSQDVIVHRGLTPVVWSVEHLVMLSAAVRRAGAPALSVHLNIDTGMSRLGARPEELAAIVDWLVEDAGSTVDLEGAFTHFACADEPDDQTSPVQIQTFMDCLATMRARGLHPDLRHVCNSAGVVRYPEAHLDMVRPGIALYGAASGPDVVLDGLRPAMSVDTRLLGIRELPAGAAVSYGHRDVLERDSRLGILPVGYGDGYMRNFGGDAHVLLRGHRCRIVGHVSMDVCMIDVTDLPDAREGERVTLLGGQGRQQIGVQELADWAGVLPYEVMCGISKRVPRRVGGNGQSRE